MSLLVGVPAVLALVTAGAFAAVAETAVGRMHRVKAVHMAQERKTKSAARLEKIVDDPAPFMNAVLFLSIGSHVGTAVLAALIGGDAWGSGGAVASAAAAGLLMFVFVSIVPKTYAVQNPDASALLVARPLYALGRLLHPVTRALIGVANLVILPLPGRGIAKGPFVTEDEIRHLVDMAEEEEEIEEGERELIHSIFEFGDTIVREVMVPRPDMVTIDSHATMEQALATITKAGYSRIPIFEGDNDNIVGVLYAKDLLKRVQDLDSDRKVRALGRAPLFVPEQKKVSELLREMQHQRVHMAIVVDEYGGTAGLVTIEDVIEEIVGEIVDEYDREEPLVEPLGDGSIRVDAKMAIDEVNELLDVDLPHEEWDTVGGLVFGLIGHVPERGQKLTYDSLEFTTERVTGRRIQKVVIAKSTRAEGPVE